MYNKTLRIDGYDIAPYVHKKGPQITFTPVYGLPDEETLDGATHTDYAGDRATIVIPFNPMTPEQERHITNLCTGGIKFLTYYDRATDTDITIRVKPVPVTSDPAMTKAGTVTHFKINNLAFASLDLR